MADQPAFIEEDIKADIVTSPTTEIVSFGRFDNDTLLKLSVDQESINGRYIYTKIYQTIRYVCSNLYHTACLTATGEVMLSGSNSEGQVSRDESDECISVPKCFDVGNHKIAHIAVGLYHTVCVSASGTALSFGGNESGQLGHDAMKFTKVPISKVDFRCQGRGPLVVRSVACGDFFTLFLMSSGEVYGCGLGANCGRSDGTNVTVADRIDGLAGSNIVALVAGASHALALSSAGELYAWGLNQNCQLGLPLINSPTLTASSGSCATGGPGVYVYTPTLVPMASIKSVGAVVGISCGATHSLVWTDRGILLGAGSNKYGQLASNLPRVEAFEALSLPGDPFCVMAACGYSHSLVLTDGRNISAAEAKSCIHSLAPRKIFAFGANNFGQVDSSSTASLFREPVEVTSVGNSVIFISAGGDQSFVVRRESSGDESSSYDTCVASSYMQRQFSTQASHSVGPMDASSLLQALNKAERNTLFVNTSITTACELFASASLLAGSFGFENSSRATKAEENPGDANPLDVAGLEACYVALLQLGSAAVVRFVSAAQQTIADLSTTVDSTRIAAESAASAGLPAAVPESLLRTIVILWHCPVNANAVLSAEVFPRLIDLLSRLPNDYRIRALRRTLERYPAHLFASRILKPVQEHLSLAIGYLHQTNQYELQSQIPMYCVVLNWLYNINQSLQLIPAESFYNTAISDLPSVILVKDFNDCRNFHYQRLEAKEQEQKKQKHHASLQQLGGQPQQFFLANHPYLISADAKRRILQAESMIQQQSAQQQAAMHGMIYSQSIGGTSFQFQPWFVLCVNRRRLLQDTLVQLASSSELDLKKPLRVKFEGEEGIDEGGVRKEYFQLLVEEIFSPNFGMFLPSPDGRSIWLNRSNLTDAIEYEPVGVLLGLAMYNGVLLDVRFPKVFYKKMLHRSLTLSDLASVDPELHKGLQQLLDFTPAKDVEQVFCQTFEFDWVDAYGERNTQELLPNGKDIAVTGANREMYVSTLVDWLLVKSVSAQFEKLREGFSRVVSPASMLLLTPDELELLVAGQPHLDFKDLQAHTDYIGDFEWGVEHKTIKAFWEVVHGLTFEDKQKLLLFITGSSRAPIGGLKNLGFKIQRMGPDSDLLPTAHTCFNTLLLPEYISIDKLRDRLSTAINECEGFGLK